MAKKIDFRTRLAAALVATGLLAGCAGQPAASPGQQANLATCTQQADAVYQQSNLNGLARTSQNGLLYSPTPDHVFDAQRMGTMSARENQINDCVANGNTTQPVTQGAPVPTPQIIGNP